LTNNAQLKKTFTSWCQKQLFTNEIIEAAALLQQALDVHLLNIYRRLNLTEHLQDATTPEQLAAILGYVDSASITLDAVLERLTARFDFITKSSSGDSFAFRQTAALPDAPVKLVELREKISAIGEEYLATLEFLQFGDEKFEFSLRDDPDFLDRILSGREPEFEDLWFRATNVDPLQNVHGIMGAAAIDALFEKGDILEIGGGTGNGIRNLFRHFAKKSEMHRVERYLFTDISQKFIMSSRKEIRTDYPDTVTDWRFADLNVPLAEQKIPPNSIDLIYAVNAAHVAKDIVSFLKSCKETLRPDGRVLFAERIRLAARDMAPRELALNLSIYHRTAAIRNSTYRPMHCYLSPDNWLKVFEEAGFKEGEIWPDIAAMAPQFPDQYAAIVTAVA